MKPKAARIHILDVDEPLLGWHQLKVRCGVVIENAEARWMFADELKPKSEVLEALSPLRICRACLFVEPCGGEKRRYLYGLSEAEPRFAETESA